MAFGCGPRANNPAIGDGSTSDVPELSAVQATTAEPLGARNYYQLAKSGWQKIPEARQMEELFGVTDHRVSNIKSDLVTAEWQSEVYFKDRYQLTMFAPVRLASRAHEVERIIDSPKFQLLEISSVEGRGVAYNSRGSREFGANDWAKLYKSKGDFSVIGIELKQKQPVPNFR
jgi:hypothetical protein